MGLRAISATVFAVLLSGVALAQDLAGSAYRCARGQGEDTIAGCSDIIGAGGGAEIAWAYFDRARAYFNAKLYGSAIEDLTVVLEFNEKDMEALENRGLALTALANYKLAIKDFDTAIELNPWFADAYHERCWARALYGHHLDDALHDCSQALVIKPNDPAILDTRCFVKFRGQAYDRAIADCTAALAADPKRASSLYIRGLAKLKMNDAAGGNADIAAAKAIDPNIGNTYASYGVRP